jgi:hypothetical protein
LHGLLLLGILVTDKEGTDISVLKRIVGVQVVNLLVWNGIL